MKEDSRIIPQRHMEGKEKQMLFGIKPTCPNILTSTGTHVCARKWFRGSKPRRIIFTLRFMARTRTWLVHLLTKPVEAMLVFTHDTKPHLLTYISFCESQSSGTSLRPGVAVTPSSDLAPTEWFPVFPCSRVVKTSGNCSALNQVWTPLHVWIFFSFEIGQEENALLGHFCANCWRTDGFPASTGADAGCHCTSSKGKGWFPPDLTCSEPSFPPTGLTHGTCCSQGTLRASPGREGWDNYSPGAAQTWLQLVWGAQGYTPGVEDGGRLEGFWEGHLGESLEWGWGLERVDQDLKLTNGRLWETKVR